MLHCQCRSAAFTAIGVADYVRSMSYRLTDMGNTNWSIGSVAELNQFPARGGTVTNAVPQMEVRNLDLNQYPGNRHLSDAPLLCAGCSP
jgi:hypothetical protein